MRKFEKWWEEEGFYYEYEGMCEDTWKAALEWILCITIDIEQNVKYIIKEELNNE